MPGLVWLVLVAMPFIAFTHWLHAARARAGAPKNLKTVAVVVLGDLGRSPRMMYHAQSFAKAGWEVYLVGYAGQLHEASSCGGTLHQQLTRKARCSYVKARPS